MKKVVYMFAVLFVALLTFGLVTAPKVNPLTEARNKAIVTEVGKYPALVRLVMLDGRAQCSGTVIAPNLVLTAAHCLQGAELQVQSLPNDKGETTKVALLPLAANGRADYALLAGNFTGFTIMQIETDPEKDLLYNQTDLVSCGFPWGAGPVCYPVLTKVKKMFEGFAAEGQMYPAMSGGPVVDLKTGKVVGVNHAIGDNTVIFMPVIGLMEMLR